MVPMGRDISTHLSNQNTSMKIFNIVLFSVLAFIAGCEGPSSKQSGTGNAVQPVHSDRPYMQDYSIKYHKSDDDATLTTVGADRNGVIKILGQHGLYRLSGGEFLLPGRVIPGVLYRPMADKKLRHMAVIRDQFVYLDNEAVFSNAWAGTLYLRHEMPEADLFAGNGAGVFLISDRDEVVALSENGAVQLGSVDGTLIDIVFDEGQGQFWLLADDALYSTSGTEKLEKAAEGEGFACMAASPDVVTIGTSNGYLEWNKSSRSFAGGPVTALPATDITALCRIDGHLWFGTSQGAFMRRADGRYNYYYGQRWLPDNAVTDIAPGPEGSVLILTEGGLGRIVFKEMTLHEKAMYYEDQVRDRHIRHGFNASLSGMEPGNIATGYLKDSDNDGLWTSMYLAGEAFRYAATGSEEALQNVRESLDGMERLFTINPVPGFPSRSFERSGYIEQLSDPERWQHAEDPEWDWKATTSSDEAIGHIFAFGVIAELVEKEDIKSQAINLIDTLMSHIVKNDFYLIDYDGKPTTWGRWHPDYVNGFPTVVGDRKLNSSNIVGMLQTAYHFTGKEKYKDAAFMLMEEHGYLENLMRPMEEIGRAPENADDWAAMLSSRWNHSDDEMYYVGYWGLYRYAFNDTLKAMYKEAILDHWEAERPEKEGLWNIFTAITGTPEFDLEEAVWYLQEHPMDLITWDIRNSHRQDITLLEPNFRSQTTAEVLPPDERPIQRHNSNMFRLDGGGGGRSEYSAGDIWLLPYWMGRYLGVISAPDSN
jgi:hypothetical protein